MHELDYLDTDGRLLKLFLAVFENNSVSAAALELGLNQSSVSYSLDRLRSIFKDPLFLKSGRGITATDRAFELVPLVQDLLTRMEDIANPLEYYPQTDTRPFTLVTDRAQWLPAFDRLYKKISKAAPNAPFKFMNFSTNENIKTMLETRKADLAISALPKKLNEDINSQPIFSEKQVCYYDPDIRGPVKSIKDYLSARHAVLDFGNFGKRLVDARLKEMKISRKIFLSSSDINTLGTLVQGTNLIITMREGLHKSVFPNLAICAPPISLPPVELNLVWHKMRQNSPGNIWFRNMVLSTLEET